MYRCPPASEKERYCILRNILLDVDGNDVRWEESVNGQGEAGNHADEDNNFQVTLQRVKNIVGTTDYSLQGINAVRDRYAIYHDGAEEYSMSHILR